MLPFLRNEQEAREEVKTVITINGSNQERIMAKGKDKPSKQTKKPKSDKPNGSGSSYQQEKASGKKG